MKREAESMTGSVLARAQSGDSDAFAELTNPYRAGSFMCTVTGSSDRSRTPRT